MSDTEGLEYLEAGFDPATLTIPRLRYILVKHKVDYPASAKKPQLIEIFTEHVLPQSSKLLAAQTRAKRTSKGITDADSSQEGTLDGELMPPPRTPRSKNPSWRAKREESGSDTATTKSPVKKTPRASSKHARASENEGGPDGGSVRKTARKSKQSEATPIKVEEDEMKLPRRNADGSVFSDDNPFQSGSSPPTGARNPSGERRRQTLGSSSSRDPSRRKSSSTSRRRTDVPIANQAITPPTSKKFEVSISQLNGLKHSDYKEVEASEEFTAEEQMELVRERSSNGQNALGPQRPKPKKSSGFSATGPLWVVLLTLLGGYATWYRQEKIAVGYCGVGREAHQIMSTKVTLPDWAVVLAEPQCEPCPQHAYCFDELRTQCESDFVLKSHPFALGGLVPLPPTCEADSEKARRVKVVADRAVEELRERRAKWECGDLVDEAGVPAMSVEIDADELKKEVSKKRRKGMSESEFEDLWAGALGEIEGREEVESSNDGTASAPGTTRLSSTSLARISIGCAIRRSFRLALARHRLQIATLILIAFALLYSRHRYRDYVAAAAAVPHLVSLTLDRLATQAALHHQDPAAFPEPWVAIGQLRDDVLRDEHSVSRREALWSKVRRIVEMNANVRSSQREGRNGEIARVWEWIGAVGSIEGGSGEGRRKSGRVSWGAYGDASSPVSGSDGGPEMVQQKWMEGRPIY